jgi:hypothetical protein
VVDHDYFDWRLRWDQAQTELLLHGGEEGWHILIP